MTVRIRTAAAVVAAATALIAGLASAPAVQAAPAPTVTVTNAPLDLTAGWGSGIDAQGTGFAAGETLNVSASQGSLDDHLRLGSTTVVADAHGGFSLTGWAPELVLPGPIRPTEQFTITVSSTRGTARAAIPVLKPQGIEAQYEVLPLSWLTGASTPDFGPYGVYAAGFVPGEQVDLVLTQSGEARTVTDGIRTAGADTAVDFLGTLVPDATPGPLTYTLVGHDSRLSQSATVTVEDDTVPAPGPAPAPTPTPTPTPDSRTDEPVGPEVHLPIVSG